MVLDGFLPGCRSAMVVFKLITLLDGDRVYVHGLDRYIRTREAQIEAAKEVNAKRDQKGIEKGQNRGAERGGERPEGAQKEPKGDQTGALSVGKIEDRRSRSTDPEGSVAEHQTELAIEDPEEPEVDETEDEPDSSLTEVSQKHRRSPLAARQPSPAEEVWVQMVEERRTRLVALQLDHEPDEKPAPAFVNSAFKRLVSRMRESDEGAGEHDVLLAYQRYLESPYGKNRKPPFALQAFLQDWCWRENWELIGTSKDPLRATGP